MKCKHCQKEMPDDGVFCPYCGKSNLDEPQQTAEAVEQAVQETGEAVIVLPEDPELVAEEGMEEEELSVFEENLQSPAVKKMKRNALIAGCLAALVLLGTVLFFGIRGGDWDLSVLYKWAIPRDNSLTGNDSYTVSDSKAWKKRNDVVATLGDSKLTNGQLQIYYWMQVIDFINEYGYYLSYVGMDYTQPLDEQMSADGEHTWQQYFLESALEAWQSNRSFYMLAKENGYELDEEHQKMLEETKASIQTEAATYGYDSADEYLQSQMGPGCTMDDYMSYLEEYYTGYLYFAELYDALKPTDAEIDAYFEENRETFLEDVITKESGKYYTIRHVLIEIEGGEKDEEGNWVYTDEEWNTCKTEAEKLYEEWKSGKMTEDDFAAMAGEYSDDDNNNANGGLYSQFEKGDMLDMFGQEYEDWCVAEDRTAGDHTLIKTEYGYCMIYFVESQDIWYVEAKAALLNELGTDIVQDTFDRYALEINYKKIVLGEVELG